MYTIEINMQNLQKLLSTPLSSSFIKSKVPFVNFVSYIKIKDMTLQEILGRNNIAIILYLTERHSGHYTTLIKNGNQLYYFNPYGLDVDDDLNIVENNKRTSLGENIPYLLIKIRDSGLPCDYNHIRLQKLSPEIETCGYWAIGRSLNRNLSNDEFVDEILEASKSRNMSPDEFIVNLVLYL